MKNSFYSSFIVPVATYGSILGIIYIILFIVADVVNINMLVFGQYANIVIIFAGLIYCIYMYRKEYLNNYITYGRAVGVGVSVMIILGIFAAVYNFIYLKFIYPDYFKELQVIMEEKLLNKNISPNDVEMIIEQTARFRTPFINSVLVLGNFILWGTIFSLIISAFMKRENEDPFKNIS